MVVYEEPLGNWFGVYSLIKGFCKSLGTGVSSPKSQFGGFRSLVGVYIVTPRVQVPNNHILSKILNYITTILKPST